MTFSENLENWRKNISDVYLACSTSFYLHCTCVTLDGEAFASNLTRLTDSKSFKRQDFFSLHTEEDGTQSLIYKNGWKSISSKNLGTKIIFQ